ncbi:M48 family metalloprotease [Sphingomonas sp.]|uniref:M48 family metalloprotease n=1 Tax=Sphingomonas sp. TaxID=28214 RepID=UPI002DBD577F|nr:M48 family metalloprotease [Sphingomonas sp.]HEU4968901.1 M48 family metalloprotease [Sphingomonas sp.]
MKMMRPLGVFAAAGALLSSIQAAAVDPKPVGSPSAAGYQPIGVDEQGLWAEQAEAERKLQDSKLLIRDPGVNAYLRSVLCRVTTADACANLRLYLVRNPAANAFMSPNGMTVIWSGLLLRLRDEAELAAVLGHEFTHFEKRHTLNQWKAARNASGWAAWLTVLSIGAGAGANFYPLFGASVASFNRDQEREADLGGLALMGRGGYRTMAASDFWAHNREEEDARAAALGIRSKKDAYRGPFSTHPMDVERMTYLRAAAEAAPSDKAFDGVADYRTALAPIWPLLIEDQIKLNDFGTSEYLLSNLARDGWNGQLLYARGELYRYRGQSGDFERAAAFYREAATQSDAPATVWRGLGLALARAGDVTGAKAAIAEYLQRNPDASDKAMLTMIGGS